MPTAPLKTPDASSSVPSSNDRLVSRIAHVLLDADDEAFISNILSGLIASGFDINSTLAPLSEHGIYAMPGSLPILASQRMRGRRGIPLSEIKSPLADALGALGAQWNFSHDLALSPMSQAAAQQNFPVLKSMAASGGCWLGLAEPSGRWERPDASPLIHLASLARGGWLDEGADMFKELIDEGVAELELAISSGAADPNHWIPALAVARLGSLNSFEERSAPAHLDWRVFWTWASSLCQDFSRPLSKLGSEPANFASSPTLMIDNAGLSLALAVEAGAGNLAPLLLGVEIAGIKLDARSMWAFSAARTPWDVCEMDLDERRIFAQQMAADLSTISRELPEFVSCQEPPAQTPPSENPRMSLAQSCGLLLAPSAGVEYGPNELALLAEAIEHIRRAESPDPQSPAWIAWMSDFVESFANAASRHLISQTEEGGSASDFGQLAQNALDGLALLANAGPECRLLADLALHGWARQTSNLFEKNHAWGISDSDSRCFSVVFMEKILESLGARSELRDLLTKTGALFLSNIESAISDESFFDEAALDHARSARALYEKTVLGFDLSAKPQTSPARARRV